MSALTLYALGIGSLAITVATFIVFGFREVPLVLCSFADMVLRPRPRSAGGLARATEVLKALSLIGRPGANAQPERRRGR